MMDIFDDLFVTKETAEDLIAESYRLKKALLFALSHCPKKVHKHILVIRALGKVYDGRNNNLT